MVLQAAVRVRDGGVGAHIRWSIHSEEGETGKAKKRVKIVDASPPKNADKSDAKKQKTVDSAPPEKEENPLAHLPLIKQYASFIPSDWKEYAAALCTKEGSFPLFGITDPQYTLNCVEGFLHPLTRVQPGGSEVQQCSVLYGKNATRELFSTGVCIRVNAFIVEGACDLETRKDALALMEARQVCVCVCDSELVFVFFI